VRLTKGLITRYLKNVKYIPRHQLINDLQSVGLKITGCSPDGQFMRFVNRHGQVRVELHGPDRVTLYHHIHLRDHRGNSLNNQLQKIPRRSVEAHIEIDGGQSCVFYNPTS
jgi:hypothetical protein